MRLALRSAGNWLASTLVFALAPLGCTNDSAPPPPPPPDASPMVDASDAETPACLADTGPVDPSMLIDDFEHAGSMAPPIAGRLGSWFTAGDATATAILQPRGL